MAIPSAECNKLMMNEPSCLTKDPDSLFTSNEVLAQSDSSNTITMPNISTPEGRKKKFSGSDLNEAFEKTPEATLKSPSSVLNPPSSIKRTIRDYFLVAS
jgi:denticleless